MIQTNLKTEAGGLQVQVFPWLQSEFKARVGDLGRLRKKRKGIRREIWSHEMV